MSKDDAKPDWAMSRLERENAERVARGLKPKRSRAWLWVLLAVLLVGAVAVDGGTRLAQSGLIEKMRAEQAAAKAAAAKAAAEDKARPVLIRIAPYEIAAVAPAPLRDTLKVTGSLAPVRQVQLSAEVSGRVLTVAAREGDKVHKGDVLVTFDTEALRSQLDQARSNTEATKVQLEQARTDFERTKSLVERGLQAPNTLDKARSALDQLTASLAAQETMVDNAQRAIERATVTAPFDGFVSSRKVDPGAFVGTGTPLVTMVDLSALEVEATAPVNYAPELTPGLPVEINVEGFGERTFSGSVNRLGPVTISGTRMLPVYVSLANPTGELRGGMFASGRIVLDEKKDGIGVPAGALRHDGTGDYVLTVENGIATRRAVTVARKWDDGAVVEIASGVAPGDRVIIEPLPELKPGMQVELNAE